MKFVTISDVHIKEPGDKPEALFIQFLNHEKTKQADVVYLLGDIFDLLVGGHMAYREKFKNVFDEIITLLSAGKIIVQLEGNHDFHFSSLIEKLNEESNSGFWRYTTQATRLTDGDKSIILAHGDEYELDNKSYQKYRKFIRSNFMKHVANDLLSFSFVDNLGKYLSKKSRARNEKNYGNNKNQELIRKRFRNIANDVWNKEDCNIYICGHSHCLDSYNELGKRYMNNGYFPQEKKFISYSNGSLEFIELD